MTLWALMLRVVPSALPGVGAVDFAARAYVAIAMDAFPCFLVVSLADETAEVDRVGPCVRALLLVVFVLVAVLFVSWTDAPGVGRVPSHPPVR